MEKLYISGKISGLAFKDVFHNFDRGEKRAVALGYEPVSPLDNGLPFDAPYDEHMKRDLEMLSNCDAILMLGNWQQSAGARAELACAMRLGLNVIFA